jgi:uncharacterized membrane protein required for colicin V production
MLGSLTAVLLVLVCIVQQYRKGGLVRGFVLFISTVCAATVAFNYYERLAKIIIDREYLTEWAQPTVFISLFLVVFIILAVATQRLVSRDVKFPILIERIGAVVCGVCLGLVIAGMLLIALAMAPLPGKYPYKRFAGPNINPGNPKKILLNPDGFVSSIFTSLSKGSFSGKKSFAVLHDNFVNQIFLNRLKDGLATITDEGAIDVPSKEAVWHIPENPTDASTGEEVYPAANHIFTVVRIGIRPKLAGGKGRPRFTLSQARLLCKNAADASEPLTGSAESVYPIGYMKMPGKLKKLGLDDEISFSGDDFPSDNGQSKIRWLDLVFNVPRGMVPIVLQFRQNLLASLPRPLSSDAIPPTASFVPVSKCATDSAQLVALSSARVYGLELAAGQKLLAGMRLPVTNIAALQELESSEEPMEIMFESNRISYLRARLLVEREQRNGRRTTTRIQPDAAHPIAELLRPLPGYQLLSLKCNNPSTGSIITAEQLPVLTELSGKFHYPVGVIASGQADKQTVYQFDYCSLTSRETADGLVIGEDGSVTEAFAEVWLTEEVQNITELYLLYLVEEAGGPIITSVWLGEEKGEVGFKKYEGFRLLQ